MSAPTIKTKLGTSFHPTGDAAQRQSLFTVTAGAPLLDARQSVSDLLSTFSEPISDAAMGIKALEHCTAWLVDHLLVSAKAVINSLIDSLEYPDRATNQRTTE